MILLFTFLPFVLLHSWLRNININTLIRSQSLSLPLFFSLLLSLTLSSSLSLSLSSSFLMVEFTWAHKEKKKLSWRVIGWISKRKEMCPKNCVRYLFFSIFIWSPEKYDRRYHAITYSLCFCVFSLPSVLFPWSFHTEDLRFSVWILHLLLLFLFVIKSCVCYFRNAVDSIEFIIKCVIFMVVQVFLCEKCWCFPKEFFFIFLDLISTWLQKWHKYKKETYIPWHVTSHVWICNYGGH